MAATRSQKTSFAAGEVAAELLGRPDLRAYANGAKTLRNVIIQPTGGLQRRPGLRHVAALPGPVRLIPFEFNTEQTYLLVFEHMGLRVFVGDAEVATYGGCPWTATMLPQLAWTQSADTLLLVHPDMEPVRITRSSHTSWTIQNWAFTWAPTHRYAEPWVMLTPSGLTGDIDLFATGPAFQPGHVGRHFRLYDKRLYIRGVVSDTHALATVEGAIHGLDATRDWEEPAFSPVHGWPVSVCFHQDRLVLGGGRDLPNRLWFSQTGDLFNFDTAGGLDDEAIVFGLVSDQVNAIRGLFSGQHLQVFTSGAEWMVTGSPLTPANIQVNRQTRVGSPVVRHVPPVDVDGATIFAARSGRSIHEFVYTDVQQVYQANDLALAAKHLVRDPVGMAYDQVRRLLHVAMADGSLATLTLYRAEQVTAWTGQETAGAFRALAEIEGSVWAAVERQGSWRLERFDETLALDAALSGAAGAPEDRWSGLGHLEGLALGVLADGAPRADAVVSEAAITLDPPATTLQAGLRFTHVVEPLPPDLSSAVGVRAAPLRLVSVTFRLLETATLAVDIGTGLRPVPFRRLDTALLDGPPPRFSGDIRLRALGWRRDAMAPLWRIADDTPLPMTLLAVTTEIRSAD